MKTGEEGVRNAGRRGVYAAILETAPLRTLLAGAEGGRAETSHRKANSLKEKLQGWRVTEVGGFR
jgi:hypothetical protein